MTVYRKPSIFVIKNSGFIRIPSCGSCQATWGGSEWCENDRPDE